MTKDAISEALGAETGVFEIVETTETIENGMKVYKESHDKKDYAEKNIKKLIDAGMKTVNDMVRVLRDTDDPKMYQASANYIETLVKINIDYAKLDEIEAPVKKKGKTEEIQNQQNNYFIGNSNDILDKLNGDK